MHNNHKYIGWIGAAIFVILGIGIDVCLIGFGFSSLLCFGCAGLIGCFQFLNLLQKRFPKAAVWLRRILKCGVVAAAAAGILTGMVIFKASKGLPHVQCEYVVVLGAGVNGTVPSLSLRERLDAAYVYLTEHPDSTCVVSGCQGNGEEISEAQCMFRELTGQGIDPERVWIEDRAANTRENIRYSLDLIEKNTGTRPRKIGVVSSEYHLYRAGLFAQEQQVAAFGIPAHTGWTALRINYYLREIAAVWYYGILGG